MQGTWVTYTFVLLFQPHVKKCFEGIDHLMFRPDKFGNQDVVGMVSSDGEEVALSNTIYPADAKGMVSHSIKLNNMLHKVPKLTRPLEIDA